MQAVLNANELKPFTRAITCLSKYGDEMIIHATANSLTLSSKNAALSAYCSVTYNAAFFHKYKIGRKGSVGSSGRARASTSTAATSREPHEITCQLLTKSFLSILKHRNTEKSSEKCELTIIEGSHQPDEELRDNEDSLESRLLVRLHCRHGVIKTHRLLLNTVTEHYVPRLFDATLENKLVVRPKAIKDIVDHFPMAKGGGLKGDPQLIWTFDEGEVKVKSLEEDVGARGKIQLATELTVGADTFEAFDIYNAPTTIGFHLREFNASTSLADSLSTALDIRFTEPSEPMYIYADADDCRVMAIISTLQVRGEEGTGEEARAAASRAPSASAGGVAAARKRLREAGEEDERRSGRHGTAASSASSRVGSRVGTESRKSAKVLARADSNAAIGSSANEHDHPWSRGATSTPRLERTQTQQQPPPPQSQSDPQEPLFLASQVSPADLDLIRSTGLGIEDMDAEEFAAMLDGSADGDGESMEWEVGAGGVGEKLIPNSTAGTMRTALTLRSNLHTQTNTDARTGPSKPVQPANSNTNSAAKTNGSAKQSKPPTNSACPTSETEEDEMEYDPLDPGGDGNFRNFDEDDSRAIVTNGPNRSVNDLGFDSYEFTGELGPTQGSAPSRTTGSGSGSRVSSAPRSTRGMTASGATSSAGRGDEEGDGMVVDEDDSQKEYRPLFED